MKNDENKLIQSGHIDEIEHDGVIRLPIKKKDLGDFISSLLGQPQKIERELYGHFNLDHEWLINLHHTLSQRIHQQAKASLISFQIVVYYKKGLKRTLNSIEAFQSFEETKKVESTAVKITWIYLLHLPSKNIPERQEIVFFASTKAPRASKPEDPIRKLFNNKKNVGIIRYEISHTERTWGDDIETIIKNQVYTILSDPRTLGKLQGIVLPILGLIFMLVGMYLPDLMDTQIKATKVETFWRQIPSLTDSNLSAINLLEAKVDILLKLQDPNLSLVGINNTYRVIVMFSGIALFVWMLYLSERTTPTFVAITKEAIKKRAQVLSKRRRNTFIHIITFILSITAGIAANYGYYWLTTN